MLDEAADDLLIALQCFRSNTEQHDIQRGDHFGPSADFHGEWRQQDFLQNVPPLFAALVAGLAWLPTRVAGRPTIADFALGWWV